MTTSRSSLAMFAVLFLSTITAAKMKCKGFLGNQVITTSVIISGENCILRNVNITGDVTVTSSGSLTTNGKVHIFGCLHGFQPGSLQLGGDLIVKGGLSVMDSEGTVFVGKNANVGTVALVAVPNFIGHGTMTSISTTESGALAIYGGRVLGGGLFRRGGQGNVKLCGASISGGLSLSGVNGDLVSAAGPNCGKTTITGAISVNNGDGNVFFSGATLTTSDLLVKEQKGDIFMQDAQLSDVAVSKLDGFVRLQSVFSDSDADFSEIKGTVSVIGSKFEGDLKIDSNKRVTLMGNNFGFEVVNVKGNSGYVSVIGNNDFSITLSENTGGVMFNSNNVRFAELTKNSGIVRINRNKAEILTCADNSPAPIGTGNAVSLGAPGQCSKL